jgi:hypothetical protein
MGDRSEERGARDQEGRGPSGEVRHHPSMRQICCQRARQERVSGRDGQVTHGRCD